jgi:PST family polysaccharide transporter
MCGMLLRVMSWPLGFMALAKGRGAIFFWTDVAAWSFFVAAAWAGMEAFGLVGTGMAFLALYIFHVIMMIVVARRLSGFRWDRRYLRYAATAFGAALLALSLRLYLPEPWATLLPALIAAVAALHSLARLIGMVGFAQVERMAARFRLTWVLRLVPHSLRR